MAYDLMQPGEAPFGICARFTALTRSREDPCAATVVAQEPTGGGHRVHFDLVDAVHDLALSTYSDIGTGTRDETDSPYADADAGPEPEMPATGFTT